MTTNTVVEGWKKLRHRSPGNASEVPTISTDVDSGFGAVRLAVGERGQPRLLLPLHASEPFPRGFDTTGLVLLDTVLTLEGGRRRFLDLACILDELDSVFAEVATEILRRISSGKGCVVACTTAISDFSALLKSDADEAVTPEKITGLVGELSLLRALIEVSSDAWENWQGVDADRHDFRNGSNSIEVKTSTRVGSPLVTISSHDQLFEPAGGSLFLQHYCLEKVAGGSITVESLATAILALASSPQKFRDKLAAVGCAHPAAPAWNSVRFEQQSMAIYRVTAGFPCITQASFPNGALPIGIDKVRYRLDLSAAAPFRLGPVVI